MRFDQRARTILVLLLTAGLIGCSAGEQAEVPAPAEPAGATAAEPVVSAPLAGSWQLVQFQSMDDAQGMTRPDRPSLYTMTLAADGTVSMQLNCNSATGTWSAEPASEGTSGAFSFGPLAVTLAVCPEPSMDERVTGSAEYVRGFMLGDGLLHLSLMADGGIWTWRRIADVSFEPEPDPAVEAAIRDASPDYTQEMVDIDGREARYVYGRVDLNDDGNAEVIAMPLGSIFCGSGGCNLFILTGSGDGYAVVNEFSLGDLPVLISGERTGGWHNFIRRESGGGMPASYVTYTFDGTRYVEGERLDGDAVPGGELVLAGEYDFGTGHPLPPRE